MTTAPQSPTELDPRVNTAVQEYLERIDRGETVDRDQFLAKYADIGDALRSFIAASEELAKFGRKSDVSVISTNSVAADVSRVEMSAKPQAGGGSQFDVLPTEFGRYRVLKLLGRGAMGAVFLAEDRQLERQVALKIPSFEQGGNGELLARFYREARSAALLRQSNICPVYDVGEIDGQHYITMAYIAGRTLSELIKSDKPPGERQILLIVRKLALALQEAHSQGIIHRDLKPGNVMIDARGEPIVMDFGLACRMEQEDAARLTQSGVIVGSPAYMSPEQIEGNPDKMTAAADQYSLGVMLYELLTGQLPFRGSIAMVIAQITTKSPQPPRELKPEIDPRVETVCLRMLSKAAKDRFSSLKAVADELATILREPKSSAATPTTTTVPSTTSATLSMVDRQREIQALLKAGDLTAAQEALNALAALNDPRMQKVADWAKQQLAKLGADALRWKSEAPAVLELARKLVKKHDYADAAKMLAQVPATFRSPEINTLLEQATDKQEECDALLADIDRAIRKEEPKELPVLVKRFLQLKPGHTGMQRLAADIKKFGVERAMRTRKGDRQYLDPAGQVWNPLHLAYAACGLAALFFGVYLTVITFQTKFGTVVIEVRDPSLAVNFHSDVVTLESSGKKYQLKPTDEQKLEIEHDGLVFVSPTVTVKRGDTTQAVVSLQGGKPALTINGEPQELTTTRIGVAGTNVDGASTAVAADDTVPADAVVYNGHAYKFYPEKLSWTEAKRRCEELGGHLPTIETEVENAFLATLGADKFPKSNKPGGATIWLGASDAAKEGDWRLLDGSPLVYKNWYGSQPNNGGDGREHYATLLLTDMPNLKAKAGQWSDQPDNATKQDVYLVCEWDHPATSPTETGFIDLFNGRDFTGWEGDQSDWIISNGVLASRRGLERPTALLTDREFSDYELRLQFRLLNPGNATVYLRGTRDDQDRAIGHVVQIGFLRLDSSQPENVTGDLFRRRSPPAEGGRLPSGANRKITRQNFLSHAEGDRRDEINLVYREREWNDLTIRCIGRREVVELNGLTTADVTDVETPLSGRIGLHLWATIRSDDPIGTTPDIQFRNIRVRELTKNAAATNSPPGGATGATAPAGF